MDDIREIFTSRRVQPVFNSILRDREHVHLRHRRRPDISEVFWMCVYRTPVPDSTSCTTEITTSSSTSCTPEIVTIPSPNNYAPCLRYFPIERYRTQERLIVAAGLHLHLLLSLPDFLCTIFASFVIILVCPCWNCREGVVLARVCCRQSVRAVDGYEVWIGREGPSVAYPLLQTREAFTDAVSWEGTTAVRVRHAKTISPSSTRCVKRGS